MSNFYNMLTEKRQLYSAWIWFGIRMSVPIFIGLLNMISAIIETQTQTQNKYDKRMILIQ